MHIKRAWQNLSEASEFMLLDLFRNLPRRIVGVMTLNKREFLKASGLALTGTMLTPFESAQSHRPDRARF